jgi:hypothetical protein
MALAVAAAAYVLAAWVTVPGFFDGFAPAAPYRWVSPPPHFRSSNRPPESASATVGIQGGASQPGHVVTGDSQATVTYPARSFETPSGVSAVSLDIKPVATYPDLGGITPASNVYLISASTRLISPVVVMLRFIQRRPEPPDQVFEAAGPSAPWKSIELVSSPVPDTLSASAQTLGYFVVGYPPAATPAPAPRPAAAGGGVTLPAVVVLAVAIAVLAALPLVAARRRAAGSAQEGTEPPPRAAPANLGGARRSRRRRGRR